MKFNFDAKTILLVFLLVFFSAILIHNLMYVREGMDDKEAESNEEDVEDKEEEEEEEEPKEEEPKEEEPKEEDDTDDE
jgi:flagellar biosynthesis/type III secretory pathway M-ring protein FliF/YscJ